jgi:CheY-like chemotaxis protein
VAVARVLLVEPNDYLRRVFRRRFEREGFELVEAVDGEGALGVARRGMLDLIVVESSVRDAAGLDLPGLLARDPDLRGVPMIVLEGRERPDLPLPRADDGDARRAVTLPAEDGHVSSPMGEPGPTSWAEREVRPPVPRPPSQGDGPFLGGHLKELHHPFRPGHLVELARGVINADAGPSGSG